VLVLDTAIVVLALAGLAAFGLSRLESGGPPVHVSGTLRHASEGPASKSRVPSGAPDSVAIPSLGVDAQLVRLGLNADGTLQVPSDFSAAGWYKLGPKPGEPGAAVVVGHVDSTAGPAVFFRLGQLNPGALVRVAWPNGRAVRFRVYAVREYRKTAFPTALVYGETPAPELRLVTCGGPFDQETGHYLDNVVVFARYAA
jgi:sortase (surface protein transpeptidase)